MGPPFRASRVHTHPTLTHTHTLHNTHTHTFVFSSTLPSSHPPPPPPRLPPPPPIPPSSSPCLPLPPLPLISAAVLVASCSLPGGHTVATGPKRQAGERPSPVTTQHPTAQPPPRSLCWRRLMTVSDWCGCHTCDTPSRAPLLQPVPWLKPPVGRLHLGPVVVVVGRVPLWVAVLSETVATPFPCGLRSRRGRARPRFRYP